MHLLTALHITLLALSCGVADVTAQKIELVNNGYKGVLIAISESVPETSDFIDNLKVIKLTHSHRLIPFITISLHNIIYYLNPCRPIMCSCSWLCWFCFMPLYVELQRIHIVLLHVTVVHIWCSYEDGT